MLDATREEKIILQCMWSFGALVQSWEWEWAKLGVGGKLITIVESLINLTYFYHAEHGLKRLCLLYSNDLLMRRLDNDIVRNNTIKITILYKPDGPTLPATNIG